MLVMFSMGIAITASTTRFAEIKVAVGASDQFFGTVLSWSAFGGLLGTLLAARLSHRFGTRRVIQVAGIVMMVAAGGYGWATSVWQLGLAAIFGGLGYSTMNVAINAQGVEIESGLGRTVMPQLHGVWSVGALAAALIGNFVTAFTSVQLHLTLNTLLGLAGLALATRGLLPADHQSHHTDVASTRVSWNRGWTGPIIIAIAFAFGMIADAGAFDWSAIHLHEDLGIALGLNSLGVTVFLLAQITGRLGGGRVVDRFGMSPSVRFAAIFGAIGYAVGLLVSEKLPAGSASALVVMLVGIYCLGLGVALIPAAFFAAAGRIPSLPTPTGIARVTLLLNLSVLVLKPTVATIAEFSTLTIALLCTAGSLLAVGWFGRVLAPSK